MSEIVQFCKVLGDETRLAILRRLSLTDMRGGEMVEWLEMPHNALSYHLKQLREIGLVHDHRSSADARDIYYSLDLQRLCALYAAAGEVLQLGVSQTGRSEAQQGSESQPLRVLFLCTHNSARSQLAQGLLQLRGGGAVIARSAGSEPTQVHPLALAALRDRGIDTCDYRAKPLSEVTGEHFDYVITVCDIVREVCPTFPDEPKRLHWSIPDPLRTDDQSARAEALRDVEAQLELRVEQFLRLAAGTDGPPPVARYSLCV